MEEGKVVFAAKSPTTTTRILDQYIVSLYSIRLAFMRNDFTS